jgi:two-component system sensor histidine kinase PilS (NtrC family)
LPSGATDNQWRALWYFGLYRLTIALLLAGLSGLRRWPPMSLSIDLQLGTWTAMAYLLFGIAFLLAVRKRLGRFALLRNLQVPVDVLALTLFLHASGGVAGGFGILQVVATAGACLLASQRVAVAYASLATLALLAQTAYGILRLDYLTASYTHAGLLGLSFFVSGLLAAFMGEQVRGSVALVAERDAELRSLAQLNEYVVQRMQAGILVLDEQLQVVLANRAALRMTGQREGIEGRPLHEISGMLNLAWRAWRARGGNRRTPLTLEPQGVDAIVSFASLAADGRDTVVYLEDTAEIHQRAQQIKLASLGRLTASIAHEIRNPLAAISHAGQLLSESQDLPAQDRRLVQIIGEQSVRMNDIVKNVLMIGRRDSAKLEEFALHPWLREFLHELAERRALPPGALSLDADPADIILSMDKSQLNQVLWTLAENALRISREPPLLRLVTGLEPETGRAFLEVIDTGPGMSTQVAEQVFEPFFTTDAAGNGLGLYLARELCEANQMSLSLLRHNDQGCVFRLSLMPMPGGQRPELAAT